MPAFAPGSLIHDARWQRFAFDPAVTMSAAWSCPAGGEYAAPCGLVSRGGDLTDSKTLFASFAGGFCPREKEPLVDRAGHS
jgi:hypothetical protein